MIALITAALLLSACNKKAVPAVATPTPAPSVSPTATATATASPTATPTVGPVSVNVVLTFQGALQSNVLIIESLTYNYATNTPGTQVASATTASGTVSLTVNNPSSPICFSANYTPAGQPAPVSVANCQPSVSNNQTITLGN